MAKALSLPVLMCGDDVDDLVAAEVDGAGHQIHRRLRRAAIGGDRRVHVGDRMEHRAGEIGDRADAGVGFGHFLLVGFEIGDEVLKVVGRHAGARHQHHRRDVDQADLLEIGRAIGQVLVQEFGGGVRAGAGHHDGVAVRRGLGDFVGADGAAGARHVLDDDLLAERLRHRADDHARGGVGRPAGRERRDQDDVAVGIILREGAWRECAQRQNEHRYFFQGEPPFCWRYCSSFRRRKKGTWRARPRHKKRARLMD